MTFQGIRRGVNTASELSAISNVLLEKYCLNTLIEGISLTSHLPHKEEGRRRRNSGCECQSERGCNCPEENVRNAAAAAESN